MILINGTVVIPKLKSAWFTLAGFTVFAGDPTDDWNTEECDYDDIVDSARVTFIPQELM